MPRRRAIIMLRSRDLGSRNLWSRDLSTSSSYQAKILYTSTSAFLFLGSILSPLQPFFPLATTRILLFEPSALAIFGEKILYVSMSRWAEMHKHMLRRLLVDQRLSRLVVMEQKKWTQSFTRKPLRGAAGKR